MKFMHDSVSHFQKMVNRLMIERREEFYNSLRKVEEKKNPTIVEDFMYAVKNNSIKTV